MSVQCKVFNENVHDFASMFKGDPVKIKAKSYWKNEDGSDKVMDLYEANDFQKDYHPMKKGADELPTPESFKMMRIERIGVAAAGPAEHVCMQCKHKSPSSHELDAHVKYTHPDAVIVSIPEEDAKPKKRA